MGRRADGGRFRPGALSCRTNWCCCSIGGRENLRRGDGSTAGSLVGLRIAGPLVLRRHRQKTGAKSAPETRRPHADAANLSPPGVVTPEFAQKAGADL